MAQTKRSQTLSKTRWRKFKAWNETSKLPPEDQRWIENADYEDIAEALDLISEIMLNINSDPDEKPTADEIGQNEPDVNKDPRSTR